MATPGEAIAEIAERDATVTLTVAPLAVPAPVAAQMCGLSLSHWRKLHGSGRCPAPITLGRKCVWSVAKLREWVANGCPPRDPAAAARGRRESRATLDALPSKN